MKRNQLDLEILSKGTRDDSQYILDPFIELYTLSHDNYIFDTDSDLEELFEDSEIEYVSSEILDNIEYEDGVIVDEELHYKFIGYDIVMQDGVKFKIPVRCMHNGCVLCDGYDLLKVEKYDAS